ncbi:FAD-dependent oxidoreductase [Streptomyces sanglieri]|uniref:FAD-dependent oxidoreductase n=1 Tax=Streptomyces sanglieri TaxID=193460 RepID=A0ABW2X7Z5_9ACTN
MRIAIVGAGLGGLTAAAALHHRGLDVQVYERGRSCASRASACTSAPTAPGCSNASASGRSWSGARCAPRPWR